MDQIERQDNEDSSLAKKIFSWLCYCSRPLTAEEMLHALAVEPEDSDVDDDALMGVDDLVSLCVGLVIVGQDSRIVSFVHRSTHDYFVRVYKGRFSHGHIDIARTCMTYLLFDAFAEGYCLTDGEMRVRLQRYPFFVYASNYWGNHVREDSDAEINAQVVKFLNDTKKLSSAVQTQPPKNQYVRFSQRLTRLDWFACCRVLRLA